MKFLRLAMVAMAIVMAVAVVGCSKPAEETTTTTTPDSTTTTTTTPPANPAQ